MESKLTLMAVSTMEIGLMANTTAKAPWNNPMVSSIKVNGKMTSTMAMDT